MNTPRHSMATRLIAAVSTLLVVFSVVLGITAYHYSKRAFKQSVLMQQKALLEVITDGIDKNLLSTRRVIMNVSRLVTVEECRDPEKAQAFLDNRPGTHSVFDNGLFLFSKEGKIIAESPFRPERRGRDISFREYFIQTMKSGKPLISSPYDSTHTPGAPAVMFTAPVLDHNGKIIAVLGGSINLMSKNFLGDLANFKIGESGYIYILNRDRTMVMHPDKQRIMKNPTPAGVNRLMDAALAGFEGGEENINSNGLRSLTSFKRFSEVGWIMGINFPVKEAYQPIIAIRNYIIIIFCLFLGAAIAVSRKLMTSITGSLIRLAEHVKNLDSKSGAERYYSCDRDDEIGLLATTLNGMIERDDHARELLLASSTHDAMTGLYNRQYFDCEIERLSRSRTVPISVVITDINGLKACNDNHGHGAGDTLIRSAADILKNSFRSEDIVARIGGDEFAVILPGFDESAVRQAVDRIRALERCAPPLATSCVISLSIGSATSDQPSDIKDVLKRADERMYADKARYYEKNNSARGGGSHLCV